ncbi:MAG: LytTR family DNA-binding domain-containing protein [bacterium]|nr:LytTR family DNA-binding domain-containing protein [bacterium]
MINYVIIDDEPIAHRIIEGYCDELNHLNKVGNCYNAMEAMGKLHQESVDLIFLDIKMPNMSGLEFLKTLTHQPKVIITTAYKEHALEGYELNVVDYLLKPFSFDRFVKAINKIQPPSSILQNTDEHAKRLTIKGDKEQHFVDPDSIQYIEAFGNYCKVFLADRIITTLEKISTFEKLLGSSNFIRVHKSFLVSKNKIQSIKGNRISLGESEIPIGQTYRQIVMTLL